MREFLMPTTAKWCVWLLTLSALAIVGLLLLIALSDSGWVWVPASAVALGLWLQGFRWMHRIEQLKYVEHRLNQPEF